MFDGKKVRSLRKQSGLTMAELGKTIGVSEAYVSMLETGKRECPDGKVLWLISNTLNCKPADLTDNKIMLAFASTFSQAAEAPPNKTISRTIEPENPTTLERENAFLRSEIGHLNTEIVNLKLQLNEVRAQLAICRKE
jgi:transcriptional regulator with XRE-family HTH domain